MGKRPGGGRKPDQKVWTRVRPTKPGWWWHLYSDSYEPFPVRVVWRGPLLVGIPFTTTIEQPLAEMHGWWGGEFPEPNV